MDKETSCINARAILNYFKQFNSGDVAILLKNLHPEIDGLTNPERFLRDQNNWISCAIISKLFQRAVALFNDDMVAYKIAKYAVETASIGYVQKIFIKAFWSTRNVLKNLQKINDKWNRNKRVELVDIKQNEAIVRLHWEPHMQSSKQICLYNQGAYTYMPLVWGGVPVNLKEICCYFENAPYCEYHIKWPKRNRLYEIVSRFFTSQSVLVETIKEMEEDKKIIEQKYEEVNRLNLRLNHKIKQILAIQETGKAILSVLELEPLLNVIINILSNVCRINRALILLVNEKDGYLEYIHGVGFDGEVPDEIKNYRVSLSRVSNILVRVANTGKPEYIHEVKNSVLRKENIILSHGNPTSVYVVPLITKSKVIGVIATDAVFGLGVPQDTRETLEIFTPQIAIAIENAKLYRTLQEQMEKLKQSQALLSRAEKFSFLGDLAARLAHEIKNPMTAIGTFIQMLPQKYNDEEFRNEFYQIALEETARVNNLITELMDLVKAKELHFEMSDLHVLITKMILLISPQSNSKNIQIDLQFSPDIGLVWIDTEKMKEVILNLLLNAVDFTPEGGKIELKAASLNVNKEKPADIRIEVKDNGPGISPAAIDYIFDPYFTTKHKSTIHNGTGLGLSIAYQNMKDHKGTIEVKSKVNAGTTFILTLPVSRPV
ncbi:ATP-binding protein [Thermodesulfobacteriota bacterium]